MTKRTIPEVREELTIIAEELRGLAHKSMQLTREIDALVVALYRQPAIRRAPVQSLPVTDAIIQGVLRMASDPSIPVNKIAEYYGINQGRVSEILNGKR